MTIKRLCDGRRINVRSIYLSINLYVRMQRICLFLYREVSRRMSFSLPDNDSSLSIFCNTFLYAVWVYFIILSSIFLQPFQYHQIFYAVYDYLPKVCGGNGEEEEEEEEEDRYSSKNIRIVISQTELNPLVPRVQKWKSANLTLNLSLIAQFVKEMVYLTAHYSVLWGFMG